MNVRFPPTNTIVGPFGERVGIPPTQFFEHTPRRVWPARALKPQLVYLSFAAFLRRKAPGSPSSHPQLRACSPFTRVALLFDSFYHMLTGAQSRSCSSTLYKPIMPLQCLLPHLTNLVNSTRLSQGTHSGPLEFPNKTPTEIRAFARPKPVRCVTWRTFGCRFRISLLPLLYHALIAPTTTIL